ncbi:MAG: septal ring lytic transglycosylase RlpA family protein [Treponema sp.]|jgi:rare lipoprotein A|nr:septal ring lytic transglycosylase RlpA family protein [Treponema sp.]
MKQLNRIFVVFFILAAFCTLQAQDITDLTVDPFRGADGYAGNTNLSGIGDYDLSVTSTGTTPAGIPPESVPAPQSGLGSAAFRQEGIASWYGTEFEGHPTASGELFNPAQLTAAHPSLPFGTMLKVTNVQNNRQVTVRVNDRGPFVNTRIIDVSRAAAEVLDILGTGTAPVVVELAEEAAIATPPQASPILPEPWIAPIPAPAQPSVAVQPSAADPSAAVVKPGIPPFGTNKRYRVQVGAYKVTRNAVDTFDRIKSLGIEPSYERHENFYRVVIAGIRAEDIQTLAGRLGSAGFSEILVREE